VKNKLRGIAYQDLNNFNRFWRNRLKCKSENLEHYGEKFFKILLVYFLEIGSNDSFFESPQIFFLTLSVIKITVWTLLSDKKCKPIQHFCNYRLSDTRYSAKEIKEKWRYASSNARLNCGTNP